MQSITGVKVNEYEGIVYKSSGRGSLTHNYRDMRRGAFLRMRGKQMRSVYSMLTPNIHT